VSVRWKEIDAGKFSIGQDVEAACGPSEIFSCVGSRSGEGTQLLEDFARKYSTSTAYWNRFAKHAPFQ
jgi:hypothetical protein